MAKTTSITGFLNKNRKKFHLKRIWIYKRERDRRLLIKFILYFSVIYLHE